MKRTILITGAADGLGLADAKRLDKDSNNQLILNVHHKLNNEKRFRSQFKHPVLILVGDVTKEDSIKSMVNTAINKFGHIDVLINNAGIIQDATIKNISIKSFKHVLETNLIGTFAMTKAVMTHMVKHHCGCIINMSSVVGLHGNFGQANYATSKSGVIGLMKTTAHEGALRGVRCNAIAPGMMMTPMTDDLGNTVLNRWRNKIPMRRFGKPDEVAKVVQFLIDDQYVTGQVITVDGGLTM